MSGGSAPAPPDYSSLINASTQQQQKYYDLMQQELDFAKNAYNRELPYTDKVQNLQLDTAQNASDFAKSQQAQYQQIYQPLQRQFVDQAKAYTDPAAMARARGQAMGAVGNQFAAAGDAAKRNLESYGIDPSATRFRALDIGTRTAQAAATAAAGTQSDVNREATGLGLEATALNIGNGLPASINQSMGTSTGSGSAGVGSGNSTYSTYSGALGNPAAFGSLANSALGTTGSLMGQSYQNQLGAFNANQNSSSGIGSVLGAGLGMASQFIKFKKGGAVPPPSALTIGSPTSRSSVPHPGVPMSLPRNMHRYANVPLPMKFAGGGAIPMAGQTVPPQMSPSGGAQTDDVPATVSGGALPARANINVGEFIMPKDVTNWIGQKALQQQVLKARKEMASPADAPAHPQSGSQPVMPQQGAPGAPNGGALPVGGPRPPVRVAGPSHYAGGGAVRRPVVAAPGAAGGAGRSGALPVRPLRPAPYPGGSGAGAVRSAIPGV